MTTRSPSRRLRTFGPTASTMPTPSCPRIVPGFMPDIVPRTKCRSVPQIALAVRRTIASLGSCSCGSGTSSTRMSPTPWYTTAFMVAPRFAVWVRPTAVRTGERRTGTCHPEPGAASAGVQRLDLPLVLLADRLALELHRRRQLVAARRPVAPDDREPLDLLHPRELRVARVHGALDLLAHRVVAGQRLQRRVLDP